MTEEGKVFLKKHENLDLYNDVNTAIHTTYSDNPIAIGYGFHHYSEKDPKTGKYKQVVAGQTITKEEADKEFERIIPIYEDELKVYIHNYNNLESNKQDALLSLMYNIGGPYFHNTNVCKMVNYNPDNPDIKDAWLPIKNTTEGVNKRRQDEINLYFGRAGGSENKKKKVYDPNYGTNNMFYELSHSPDWTVVQFKRMPRSSNDWKFLIQTGNESRPKVGDILFGYHNNRTSGQHDHVAIYLGLHGHTQYVAEGCDYIDGDSGGVQIVPIGSSRFGSSTDVITHFAHCNKYMVSQTSESNVYVSRVRRSEDNFSYSTAVGQENMRYFDLFGFGDNGLRAPKNTDENNNLVYNYPKNNCVMIQQCLIDLCCCLLDPLQKYLTSPEDKHGLNGKIGKIAINSSYRDKSKNSSTPRASQFSQHMYGQAVDIRLEGATNGLSLSQNLMELAKIILENQTTMQFDQLILEGMTGDNQGNNGYKNANPTRLHISYRKPRKQGDKSNRDWNSLDKLGYQMEKGPYQFPNQTDIKTFILNYGKK